MFNLGWNFYTFNNPFANRFSWFNYAPAYTSYMPANYYNYQPCSIFQNRSTFNPAPFNPEPISSDTIFSSSPRIRSSASSYAEFDGVKYNKSKAERLADNIVKLLPKNREPENPLCAKHVKNAIEVSGLGRYELGNADACTNIFRSNPRLKEIKVDDLTKIPRGSVVVYNAFDTVRDKNGNVGQIGENGHTIIALGNGKACSDIMEDEILQSDNAQVFLPA